MKKLNIGLIGLGYIAGKAIAPAIKRSKHAKLEAVASRDFGKAKQFATQFGCRPLSSYQGLINDPKVDCVYISLPNALHYRWIIAALKAGKHVIVDKPAVLSFREARQVVETAKRNKVRFLEGYMFRFHPQHAKVLELIEKGAIGEILHYEAAFGFPPLPAENFRYSKSLGGGAINDAAGYLVSGSRMMFGQEPVKVHATVHKPKGLEVETRGAALLSFPGSRTAQITFGFEFSYRNCYTVWGSKGTITANAAFTKPTNLKPTIVLTTAKGTKNIPVRKADHFELMIDRFASGETFLTEFLAQAKAIELLRQQ